MNQHTNSALIGGYITDCRRRYLADRTVQNYAERLDLLQRYAGDRTFDSLTKNDVEEWLDLHAHCAQTRQSYRSTAVQLYTWANDNGHIEANPARATSKPRVPKGRPRPAATSDVHHSMSSANKQMRVILTLAAYAGLRCIEIARLEAEDVDLPSGWLVVRRGKGDRTRTVPLHAEVVAALGALPMPARGPVVHTKTGKALDAHDISTRVKKHLAVRGIRGSAHRFRHWFATSAADSGADIMTIKELLGHSSVATTQIYVGWAMRRGRDAVDAIPRAS